MPFNYLETFAGLTVTLTVCLQSVPGIQEPAWCLCEIPSQPEMH